MRVKLLQDTASAVMYITDYGRAAGEVYFSLLSQVRKAAIQFYQFITGRRIKMSKVAVVYWSGTGNTEVMANSVADGASAAGADVKVFTSAEFGPADIAGFDGIAFGCPAMGAEVLEESEFQPLWDDVKMKLSGKKVGLFGSYGWGSGEWMDSWAEDAKMSNVSLAADPVIANNEPDDEAKSACEALGATLV